MIEPPVYRLRPPLRKPGQILGANSSQRSNTGVYEKPMSPAAPEVGAAPVASPSRVPPPPRGVSAAGAHPERVFLCCVCGERAVGHVPYGWLRLLRAVHPNSLPADRLLIRRDRKGRAKYADMQLGTFCRAECLELAMSGLIDLAQDLAARGVGMWPSDPIDLGAELTS